MAVTHFNSEIIKEQKQITAVSKKAVKNTTAFRIRKRPLLTGKMKRKQINTERKRKMRNTAKTTTRKKLI